MALLLSAPAAHATEYTFTNIFDSSQHDFDGAFNSTPSLNDLGEVAFVLQRPFPPKVYKGSGGPLTAIATSGYPTIRGDEVSINNAGQVAFLAEFFDFQRGIFRGDGGPITTIVHSSGPLALPTQAPWLDDAGRVVFHATPDAGGPGRIYIGDGTLTTLVFGTHNTPLESFALIATLTEDGAVSFTGTNEDTSSFEIYRGIPGGPLTLIESTGGQYCTFGGAFTANNVGQVLWMGSPGPPVQTCPPVQILVGDGGDPTVVADAAVDLPTLASPALNDAGTVVVWSVLPGGDEGIFTNEDFSNAVIQTGDALFGSSVEIARINRQGFNEAGQIAFRYQLADGREGFARADPVTGPPACDNGADDDGDGLADLTDPGCAFAADVSEHEPSLVCDDGWDNDGDGAADHPADIGCASLTASRENPQCQDGVDNDGALGTDFDGGESVLGVGNGDPDGPDPNCGEPWQDREANPPTTGGCGLGPELALLLPALALLRRRRRAG